MRNLCCVALALLRAGPPARRPSAGNRSPYPDPPPPPPGFELDPALEPQITIIKRGDRHGRGSPRRRQAQYDEGNSRHGRPYFLIRRQGPRVRPPRHLRFRPAPADVGDLLVVVAAPGVAAVLRAARCARRDDTMAVFTTVTPKNSPPGSGTIRSARSSSSRGLPPASKTPITSSRRRKAATSSRSSRSCKPRSCRST